jgi:2-polyprenyl-3-methyl-5-hydroxy-6-metoxy-1,4-benzoquinol methylase
MSFIFKTCRRFLVKLSPAFTGSRNTLYVDFAHRHLKEKVNQKSLNLLDAGGSDGYLAYLISKRLVAANFSIFAVVLDSPLSFLKVGRKKHKTLNFVCGDVNHLPFRPSIFDTVCSFSVFEHLNQPQAAVKEMTYVSKGLCVVQIPNMHYFIEPHTKVPFLYLFPTLVREKIERITQSPYFLNFNVLPVNLTDWFSRLNFSLVDFSEVYYAKWTMLFRVPQGYLNVFMRRTSD